MTYEHALPRIYPITLLYSHTVCLSTGQMCSCCPLCLWSVSMKHLCTEETYQRYKYVWAYMWVEREHVTPDQLRWSNALKEFRLRGNMRPWINSSALMHLQSSDSGGNIWPHQLCFNHRYKHTHALYIFWGESIFLFKCFQYLILKAEKWENCAFIFFKKRKKNMACLF